jgi:hypothetical protein
MAKNALRTTDVQTAPGEELTLQEQIYAERRAEGMTKAASARAAGFDDALITNAYTIEARPPVRAMVQKLRQQARDRAGVKLDDVIEGFKSAISTAATAGEQIAGWREIAKVLGFYEQAALEIKIKHEHTIPERDITPERLGSLPTRKLLELSGELIEDADWDDLLSEDNPRG